MMMMMKMIMMKTWSIEDGISLNFLGKSLQNLSTYIEQDGDTYINSPLAKKRNVLHH